MVARRGYRTAHPAYARFNWTVLQIADLIAYLSRSLERIVSMSLPARGGMEMTR